MIALKIIMAVAGIALVAGFWAQIGREVAREIARLARKR